MADAHVNCYSGLRLLSRFFGRAVAGVGLSTDFLRPENPTPTVQEEAALLSEQFRLGVEEVLSAGERTGRAERSRRRA